MKKRMKILLLSVVLASALCGTAAALPFPAYVGVDMGYVSISPEIFGQSVSGGGFEVTPYIGINPIASVPDLSFEFNLGLSFPAIEYSIDPDGGSTLYSSHYYEETVSIISPQLFAVYTLDK